MCVCLQVRTYGLDERDVYMSSYENRFRLFSSVEYEGQLYMTPLNFIESITLNEPKSECTQLFPSILHIFWRKEGTLSIQWLLMFRAKSVCQLINEPNDLKIIKNIFDSPSS